MRVRKRDLLPRTRNPAPEEACEERIYFQEVNVKDEALTLTVEELEQRIAPDTLGDNPDNNNPPLNNTNNPGNEGTGGQVSTGPTP